MHPAAVRLKVLLQQRHWQTYRTFCGEYDRAAATVDKALIGTAPSRAQLHRWLSGELIGLPYPDHCRVLEAMLPGHTAADLFRPVTAPTPMRTGTPAPTQAVELRPHVEAAFTRRHVTVDFAGFSGETLHGALTEPLDKIRAGRLTVESLAVRLLLPDLTAGCGSVPAPVDDRDQDAAVRARAERISRRHTEAIAESVHELGALGLVDLATVEVRRHNIGAPFKVFILNGEEAFFGFYPVVTHTVTVDRQRMAIHDVLGKDVPLFHYRATEPQEAAATLYVHQARRWFDSVWTTVARPDAGT